MIVIIDYGMGNIGSIANMLKKVGANAAVASSDADTIAQARKLILPGVGSFDHGMTKLKELGLVDVLHDRVCVAGVPVLGICLGMQLMTQRSEEGNLPGLGWIDAETVRFNFGPGQSALKIPHMGWNTVTIAKDGELFASIHEPPRFYFVHSYHAVCRCPEDVMARAHHGYEFVAGFSRANITGVQFHPEKSHKYGMTFLRNWTAR
jgi:imidazole glycerol-phosphate synthase subunit HisH